MDAKAKRKWWPVIITALVGILLIVLLVLDYRHLVMK